MDAKTSTQKDLQNSFQKRLHCVKTKDKVFFNTISSRLHPIPKGLYLVTISSRLHPIPKGLYLVT